MEYVLLFMYSTDELFSLQLYICIDQVAVCFRMIRYKTKAVHPLIDSN